MSKSIYKEALLDIVIEALEQPDKSVIIKHTGLNELKKALEQAQKQEKLLELYKRVYRNFDYLTIDEFDDLEQQIKELENE